MQTGFQIFNFQIKGSAVQSPQCAGAGAQKGKEQAAGKFSDFMEIMGALMALQPEQWQNSMSALQDGLGQIESISDEETSGSDPLDIQQSDLMGLFLDLKGVIQKELANSAESDQANKLLEMAEAIMNDGESLVPAAAESEIEKWKAQWLQMYGRQMPGEQAGAAQETTAKDMSSIFQSSDAAQEMIDALKKTDGKTGGSKNALDAQPDLNTASTTDSAVKATSPEAFGANGVRKLSQMAPQASQPNDPQAKLDLTDASAAPKTTHDQLQRHSIVDGLYSGQESRTVGQDDSSEAQGLLKPSVPTAGQLGVLARLPSGADQSIAGTAESKEAVAQDKDLQPDVIRQIVQRMSMQTQGGQSKMVIHLKPEYLGDVHMQVLTQNHQVTVRMTADSLAVKEIVEQNIQHLRTELQQHGLQIQKFDVFVANDNEGWKNRQEQAGFRESRHNRRQRFDSAKATVAGSEPLTAVSPRATNTAEDLSEIDYFA